MSETPPLLQPIPVTVAESEFQALAREVARLTERETVLVPVRGPLTGIAAGFAVQLPPRPVGAAPGTGDEARRRAGRWRDAPPGLLLGAATAAPLRVPGIAEGEEAVWLEDLTIGGEVVARLGVAPPTGAPSRPAQAAVAVAPRLARILWERVAAAWRHNLATELARAAAEEPGPTDPDRALRRRLDVVAREVARATGAEGAGVFTWREALLGHRLDGYWGPEIPEPPGLHARRPGWWFHPATDPSLVGAVRPPEAQLADDSGSVVVWKAGGRGPAPNPAALEEFRRRHGELAVAVAAPLPPGEEPLRPVVVVFAREQHPSAQWLPGVGTTWSRVPAGAAAGIAALRAAALREAAAAVASALDARRRALERRAVTTALTSSLLRRDTDPAAAVRGTLAAVRDLAGAWSGALWAVDRERTRRRALALLHPDDRWPVLRPWHPIPAASSTEVALERLGTGEEWLAISRLERRGGRWTEIPGNGGRRREVTPGRRRWLEAHRRGREVAWSLVATLRAPGPVHGLLALTWWYPPPPPERLAAVLAAPLEAVTAAVLAAVALEERESRAAIEARLDRMVNGTFQRWLAAVRGGSPPQGTGGPRPPLAEAPAELVRELCAVAEDVLGRTVWYFRYEHWADPGHPRTSGQAPVARRIAPSPSAEPAGLDPEVLEDLEGAARCAAEGKPAEPFDVEIPDGGDRRTAVAFPAVVGGSVAGLLAVAADPAAGAGSLGWERPVWVGFAATAARLAELLRRNVYRHLDGEVARALAQRPEAAGPGPRRARAAAAAIAGLARTLTGARAVEVHLAEGGGRFRRVVARPAPGRRLLRQPERHPAVRRLLERDDHHGWKEALGDSEILVVPLRTPGTLHGLLAAAARNYWSLDTARVLEALCLRAAPALAHALELDRLFLGLAGSQHATRSAWQQAFAAAERIQERLLQLKMFEGELESAMASLREALERARVRMASALYLATGTVAGGPGSPAEGDRLDLNRAVPRILGMYRLMAAARSLRLEPDLPAVPAEAAGDPGLVELLLENLVENAVKYAREETAVWVRVRAGRGVVVVTVGDVGRAFPHPGRLAQPLRRGVADGGGYGIGLAVVDACCRALGAEWRVSSRPVRGDAARDTPAKKKSRPRCGDTAQGGPPHRVEVTVRLPRAH